MHASSAGLDVQLKILQALPSLLQNYAADLQGELLVTTLNVCFILQSSKNAIVNNTSAATLQQLVVAVFDKVVVEDSKYHARYRIMSPILILVQRGQAIYLSLERLLQQREIFNCAPQPWMLIGYANHLQLLIWVSNLVDTDI